MSIYAREKPCSPVFVSSCQPGPARSSPARFDKSKASLFQPSLVTKKASPTIPGGGEGCQELVPAGGDLLLMTGLPSSYSSPSEL